MAYDITDVFKQLVYSLNNIFTRQKKAVGDMNKYSHYFDYEINQVLDKWLGGEAGLEEVRHATGKLSLIGVQSLHELILPTIKSDFSAYIKKAIVVGNYSNVVFLSATALPLHYFTSNDSIFTTAISNDDTPTRSETVELYAELTNLASNGNALYELFTILTIGGLMAQVKYGSIYKHVSYHHIVKELKGLMGCGSYTVDMCVHHLIGIFERIEDKTVNIYSILGTFCGLSDNVLLEYGGVFKVEALRHKSLLKRIFFTRYDNNGVAIPNTDIGDPESLTSVIIHLKSMDLINGINLGEVRRWAKYVLSEEVSEFTLKEWCELLFHVGKMYKQGIVDISTSTLLTNLDSVSYETRFSFTNIPTVKLPWWGYCLSIALVFANKSLNVPIRLTHFEEDLIAWINLNEVNHETWG